MNLINNSDTKKNESNETQSSNNTTQKSNPLSQENLLEKQSQAIRKLNGQKQSLEIKVAKTKIDCSDAIREANRKTEEAKKEYSRRESQSYSRFTVMKNSYENELQDVKEQLRIVKHNHKIALISLLFVFICCLIKNKILLYELWDFIRTPTIWIKDKFILYINWMKMPYYTDSNIPIPFSNGWAWTFRIITPILILAIVLGIVLGLFFIIRYYKKRWCNLSMKVVIGSLAILTIFGDIIRQYIPINLILLFLIIQILYLLILKFFDWIYEVRYGADNWKKIQNY